MAKNIQGVKFICGILQFPLPFKYLHVRVLTIIRNLGWWDANYTCSMQCAYIAPDDEAVDIIPLHTTVSIEFSLFFQTVVNVIL